MSFELPVVILPDWVWARLGAIVDHPGHAMRRHLLWELQDALKNGPDAVFVLLHKRDAPMMDCTEQEAEKCLRQWMAKNPQVTPEPARS